MIEDKLPRDLSYECIRIKLAMQKFGVGPKYLNVFEEDMELKSPQSEKQTPQKIEREIKGHFTPDTAENYKKETSQCEQRSTNLKGDKLRVRGNTDGKLSTKENKPVQNRTSSYSGIKTQLTPNLDEQYKNATYIKSDQK